MHSQWRRGGTRSMEERALQRKGEQEMKVGSYHVNKRAFNKQRSKTQRGVEEVLSNVKGRQKDRSKQLDRLFRMRLERVIMASVTPPAARLQVLARALPQIGNQRRQKMRRSICKSCTIKLLFAHWHDQGREKH